MKRDFAVFGFLSTLMIGVLSVAIWVSAPVAVYANTNCDTHCWYNSATGDCRYSASSTDAGTCDVNLEECKSLKNCKRSGPSDCSCTST